MGKTSDGRVAYAELLRIAAMLAVIVALVFWGAAYLLLTDLGSGTLTWLGTRPVPRGEGGLSLVTFGSYLCHVIFLPSFALSWLLHKIPILGRYTT